MKSTVGNQLKISVFGESHGEAIGVVMDGLAPGIEIDESFIAHQMDLRKPKGTISTQRKETDQPRLLSGVFEGKTTGTPVCILIENSAQHSQDYEKNKQLMRPSHADYTAYEKYLGYQDYRGGGHFSGRLTAPLVAAGAICLSMLKKKGIILGSHIASLHGISDIAFSENKEECVKQVLALNDEYFAILDPTIKEKMLKEIEKARQQCDSVGGIVESIVLGMPAGVGEPMFNSIESTLSHLLFSVGAVKGVEFGLGFRFEKETGSSCNDEFLIEEGKIRTTTNYNGGINGGISNGMPILVRSVIKPTPSIFQKQNTINILKRENTELTIEGRHDPCIVHRARVVIDSMIAIGLVDLLIERYGLYAFAGEKTW